MAKQRAENSSLSELPLIEWKEAASVAGEDDEGFLVDLLAGFYEEEFHVIDEIIEVFREYREGKSMDAAEAGKKVQNLAHRLKGAAANIRLMRLTRSAYLLEQKFKTLVEEGKNGEIDKLLKKPPTELLNFAEEMDTFIDYLRNKVKPYVSLPVEKCPCYINAALK
eukprot:gb/GECG01003774.1/.p1 GENE.gb/GECG01003774.1/~~gb/GECG01003774.1/.p1  ORF type:complete len:166 (+),score=35.99 gb/GECG01003774.1/:1-498(+)